MKTLEGRAREIAGLWLQYPTEGDIRAVVLQLKEACRDQRHACAERVIAVEPNAVGGRGGDPFLSAVNACHAECMNTPFPGDGMH
jgi:hypothetical protein